MFVYYLLPVVWYERALYRKSCKNAENTVKEQNESIGRVGLTQASSFTPSGFFTRHPELFPKSFIFLLPNLVGEQVQRCRVCTPNAFSALIVSMWGLHSAADTFSLKGQLKRDLSFAFQHFLLPFLIHTEGKKEELLIMLILVKRSPSL